MLCCCDTYVQEAFKYSSLANNLVLYVLPVLICVMIIYDFWIGEMGIRPVRLVNLVVLDTNEARKKILLARLDVARCTGVASS